MRKVTPRIISDVESGSAVVVKFTSVRGHGRGGKSITHEGTVEEVDSPEGFEYVCEDGEFTFELDTGYIRQSDDVIGRDGRAKLDEEE